MTAPAAEYLIMESTYGNRLHQPIGPVKQKLANLVKRVPRQRGGHIVVPAFAVGRTQQVVMLLHELINEKAIPDIPIFVDSPLAVNVTDVFRKHEEEWDEEMRASSSRGNGDPFGWKRLRYTATVRGEQGAERSAHALHRDLGLGHVRGWKSAASPEEQRRRPAKPGADYRLPGGRIRWAAHRGEAAGGEDLRRADAAACRGRFHRRAERTCGPARASGVDGAGGADAEAGLPVHGEPDAQQTLKAEIEKLYKLDVVCPKRGDRFAVS